MPLFDIVGLDEGTCGRRPRVWRSRRRVLGIVSRSYMSLTHHVRFVQEWLLEMSCSDVGYSTGAGVDIKLESLILAQNERWRHA